ncbi:MAG TPA: peptidase S9, partial [Bacteroides sp.]|nr:peptidase S9 [Bacteroides sp.]
MKIFASSMAVTLAVLVFSCQTNLKENAEIPPIFTNEPEMASDIMTPEVLWSFGRLSDVQVSPSGEKILYGVTYYSTGQNKSNRELFVMGRDGSGKLRLTETKESEFNAVWHPDGKRIVYLSPVSGEVQVWVMNGDGKGKKKISQVAGGINSLAFSPAGDRVLFTKDVKVDTTRADLYPDLPKADARIITDLMYRHWDTWEDGAYSHIFVAGFDGEQILGEMDIMPGEPYDSPLMPFGGTEEITWSPDGKQIAYTCKKLKGKDYTLSTNSQIYLYDLESGETSNMTAGLPGYDKAPLFSPDGKELYWLSMERAGFEADRDRLFRLDLVSGERTCLTPEFDHSPSGLTWGNDGNTLYFIAGMMATFQICRLDISTGMITPVTAGD